MHGSLCKYLLIILFIIPSLFANDISEDEYRLINSMSFEELLDTTIATGVPIKQKFAPAVTSILTSSEIRKSGARTLHEALEQVPGLHIYPSDLDLMSQKISIRGIQTGFNPQVLFLMDGVPLNDLLNGHPGFIFSMPISIIHRIEIIRGAGSALHGADAFSGVINIISKKHDNMIDQVGMRYGSFNTWEGWVNQSIQTDTYSVGLSLALMQSNGDNGRIIDPDASNASGAVDSRYDTVYLHADYDYKEIRANILLERSRDLGLGAGHLRMLDTRGYVDRDKLLTDIMHTNDDWFKDTIVKTRGYFSYSDSQANFYPKNSWQQGNPYAKEYVGGVSNNFIYMGLDKHTLNVKVGLKYAKLDPSQTKNFNNGGFNRILIDVTDNPSLTYMLEQSRTNYYGLIQDEYMISDALALTVGIRYDYYNDFGSTYNPRLAIVWQESKNVTLKAMYAEAFRAPSFGELYLINNPQLVGNKDLNPETIDTYELVLNYRGPVNTKLNLFYYEAKDLIDYVQDPSPLTTSSAQNIKDQSGYGLELELEYKVTDSVSVRGNYSYQDSEDEETKEKIANAPMHQAFAQIQYKPSREWNLNTQYFYIGERDREDGDTRAPLESNSLVNLTIERTNIIRGLDGIVSARNLFDEDYKEPSSISIPNDYPMQGLYMYAELRYRF